MPTVWADNWDFVGINRDDIALFGEIATLPNPMPFFDYDDPAWINEGRTDFEVYGVVRLPHGSVPQFCEASDSMRMFYMKPDDQCYAMVDELDKIPQPPNDPVNGFVTNQRCIAKYSCGNRPQMQDKTWLTKVVPAFVQPFLDKSGKWNEVIGECRLQSSKLPSYIRKRSCEKWMADYHIAQDLQHALNANGCGTLRDWEEVGGYIKECVVEQSNALETAVINLIVAKNRNKVRQICTQQNGMQNLATQG
ncbi:MAG: hypothetical protein NVS3B11_04400 [Collimonas sp.]